MLDRVVVNGPISQRWSGITYLVSLLAAQLALAASPVMAQGRQQLIPDRRTMGDWDPGATADLGSARLLHQPSSLATGWTPGQVGASGMAAGAPPDGCEGAVSSACDAVDDQACEDCGWPVWLCTRLCHGRVWQSLTLFRHSGTSPRAIGKGQPLVGTSWLNRPYYAGWFLGPIFGNSPIDGMDQDNGAFGGLLLGWDADHYWGTQLRFGWSAMRLTDPDFPQRFRNNDIFVTDLSLLYYPWGDSRWRPYCLLGLGAANFSFADQHWIGHDTTLLGMPFGGGLKYQFRRWWALRVELIDNLAYGSEGLNTVHNVSLTIDMELHWGSKPSSYWPWRPGRHGG